MKLSERELKVKKKQEADKDPNSTEKKSGEFKKLVSYAILGSMLD